MAKRPPEKHLTTSYILAELISAVLSPVTSIILIVGLVIYKFNFPVTKFLIILTPFVASIIIFMIVKVGILRDADLDLTRLKMRQNLGITAMFGFILTYILALIFLPAANEMFSKAGIIIVIMALVTSKWKISIHAISYTSLCLTCIGLFGPRFALTLLLLPVLYWSRLKLKKHTLPQLLAGSAICLVILI